MIKEIYIDVENKYSLKKDRLVHIYGVIQTAKILANYYGYDPMKAEIAALFHDYTKYDSLEFQQQFLTQEEILKYKDFDVMYHAISASRLLKEKYKINDEEVLEAIYNHVWGKTNMSVLDKIILIADKTEPSRNYPGVEEIRKASFKSLDEAIIIYTKNYILHEKSLNRKYPKIVDDILEELLGD